MRIHREFGFIGGHLNLLATWILILIGSTALVGCGMITGKDPAPALQAEGSVSSVSPNNSALTTQAVSILQTNCASCHGSSGQGGVSNITNPSNLVATNLIVPGDPASSTLYTAISSGTMPLNGPLSSSDATVIRQWIQTGFSQTPTPSPSPSASPSPTSTITTSVSFSKTILPTLKSSCVSCHSGNGGLTNLSSYTGVSSVVKAGSPNGSQLYTEITPGGSMAKHAPSGFSAEVSGWIAQGALNN
jgi:mono/diheme cytochrome c family protein